MARKAKAEKAWVMVHSHDADGKTPLPEGPYILTERVSRSRPFLLSQCSPWNRVIRVEIRPVTAKRKGKK